MDILQILNQAQMIVGEIVIILSALIAVFMVIPGDEPEKSLQKVLDFIKKLSKK
jgi:hypothetical protein